MEKKKGGRKLFNKFYDWMARVKGRAEGSGGEGDKRIETNRSFTQVSKE